uniref:Uncharacterized protein n=1 Tax=Linum usitatissimum TaxID=4006 RepID=A0A172MLD8_LINUS|nr:hypothetical protein [Linum usitatissimum]
MKQKLSSRLTNFFSVDAFGAARRLNQPPLPDVDVREEYANAFRTESYLEFWTRVFTVSDGGGSATGIPANSTNSTAARLSSYRLFVEHLLDPDQLTVTRVLDAAHIPSSAHSLLAQYFAQTADASSSCGSLLKDINRVRVAIRTLKSALKSLETGSIHNADDQFQVILSQLATFADTHNPFNQSNRSPVMVRSAQINCTKLLKPLESIRDKAHANVRLRARLKHGSAMFLVALTASLTVILATHALALLIAAPTMVVASIELVSTKKLNKVVSELDVAAKGMYILSRDLETINGLVARLSDELEHMCGAVKFWLDRGETWVRAANGEVWKELRKNERGFSQHLDELEEHLYLCFMTINRARNLVVKEILDPGRAMRPDPNILSK